MALPKYTEPHYRIWHYIYLTICGAVLPLYSVMKTISPSLMRAGKSLGGTPFVAFWKVYFPLTIPGIGAGCLLAVSYTHLTLPTMELV